MARAFEPTILEHGSDHGVSDYSGRPAKVPRCFVVHQREPAALEGPAATPTFGDFGFLVPW